MAASLQAAVLGVVQGLTEFLPVSSSAHLIIARAFFGFDPAQFGLAFDVAVHLGTALAVVAYFFREIARMLVALPAAFRIGGDRSAGGSDPDAERLVRLLAVGTIPAVIAGVLFDDVIEQHLRTPQVSAVALSIGAIAFLLVERVGARTRDDRSLTVLEAVWIGCGQALALVPGVSRSGATMSVALLLGLRRVESARFVFLLGVPAILGAAVKEMPTLFGGGAGPQAVEMMAVGISSSMVVGYLAITLFIRYVGSHSLAVFAWYRLALSASVLAWLVAGGRS
jgi:undecaprenyl-diphosphatase